VDEAVTASPSGRGAAAHVANQEPVASVRGGIAQLSNLESKIVEWRGLA